MKGSNISETQNKHLRVFDGPVSPLHQFGTVETQDHAAPLRTNPEQIAPLKRLRLELDGDSMLNHE